MPAAAPTALEIERTPADATGVFSVVDIDQHVIAALSIGGHEGFAGRFRGKAPAADLRVAVGDVLQISVLEQSPGSTGLFSDTGGSTPSRLGGSLGSTAFQPISVERNGRINVPFAGSIQAAGQSLDAIREEIERKLANKAINPQVQISLVGGTSVGANSVTVAGEVNRAGVLSLRPSGSRLLDVIAEAGGAKYPAFETTVRLTRKDREGSAVLQTVVANPSENVFVYPGDTVYVSHDPRTFTILGASLKVGRYPFDSERVNLAEAVAQSGGFSDTAADPSGVFLFRFEDPRVARAIGVESGGADGRGAPIIYRLNLREGDGYFLAKQFDVKDKDILLVANSDGAQLVKFVNLLQGVAGLVQTGASTALTIKTIRSGGSAIITTAPNLTGGATTTTP